MSDTFTTGVLPIVYVTSWKMPPMPAPRPATMDTGRPDMRSAEAEPMQRASVLYSILPRWGAEEIGKAAWR